MKKKSAVKVSGTKKPGVKKAVVSTEKKTTSTVKKAATTEKKAVIVDDKRLTIAELENFKEKLVVIRARLRGNVINMANVALNKNRMDGSGDYSAMPIHMADIGSDNFEQEQTLSFMQSEHGLLEMVDEALARVKEGTYGICENCECRIPKARLNAIPYAIKCVQCAASDEQN